MGKHFMLNPPGKTFVIPVDARVIAYLILNCETRLRKFYI